MTEKNFDIQDKHVIHEGEKFMTNAHKEHFRNKLIKLKEDIIEEHNKMSELLQETNFHIPDINDRAAMESYHHMEFRTRERQLKLITKIDAALQKIEDGTYGYCEITGEPISLKRLEVRPIATLTVEAQENYERKKKNKC
jgi:DnaK suppressor protein